jgi:hypothetical protein
MASVLVGGWEVPIFTVQHVSCYASVWSVLKISEVTSIFKYSMSVGRHLYGQYL